MLTIYTQLISEPYTYVIALFFYQGSSYLLNMGSGNSTEDIRSGQDLHQHLHFDSIIFIFIMIPIIFF